MPLTTMINEIAQQVSTVDPGDLAGLLAAQEALEAAMEEAERAEFPALASGCREAANLANAVIMREAEDLEGAVARIVQIIEAVRTAATHDVDTDVIAELSRTDRDVDLELLGQWLSSTIDHLATLESLVVSASDEPEGIAEARRILHTLKGEAGFLALDEVRDVCHEAESAIDACLDGGAALPVDDLLALVDWMKSVVGVLETDPNATLPSCSDLIAKFVETTGGAGPAPGTGDPARFGADAPSATNAPAETAAAPSESAPAAAPAADPAEFSDPNPVTFPGDMGMDENLADFCLESREHFSQAEEGLLELDSDPTNNEELNRVFRAFHTVKGVAGFMNLTPIVEFAHEAETLLDHARTGKLELGRDLLDLVLKSCDHLSQLVASLEGEDAPTLGQHHRLLDGLKRAIRGEYVADSGAAAAPAAAAPAGDAGPATAEVTPKPATAAPANAPAAPSGGGAKRPRVEQTVKVATSRLDTLVTMVGELVIAQQMVAQDPNIQEMSDVRLQRSLSEVGKIIRDLQNVSMALSMVPVKGTFQKMARLVRDVSAKAGKQVTFAMEGEDTELDRNVVEEIGDPLVHMVRNACDHGIETPADRREAGKPDSGTLTLRAYHAGGSIIIEIQDDGRGLNRDKILSKAVERGLIPADRNLADIPDFEAYNMIFMPGFSTADKITDISGRGVGMDVVRKNIEALRGAVEIDSEPGKGSIFRMKLPLTMAIIDGMVVRVGSERFVVPTVAIEQSFRPTDEDLETTLGGGEMARIRGRLLPIHRLKRVFNLAEGHDELSEGLLLVLESSEGRFCLAVDHILGQQQVVIKNLGEAVAPLQGVAGGAILGDGRVALILDVTGIQTLATEHEEQAEASAEPVHGSTT